MAIYRHGNMWTVFDEVDHFLITTNSFLKQNGALVMGAGIAKQVRDTFPGIDRDIGAAIRQICGHLGRYGVLLGNHLGVFQVKYYFVDPADLDLIRHSTNMLGRMADQAPTSSFALNFPGIGNGKLAFDDVYPIVDALPDNVQIWTF